MISNTLRFFVDHPEIRFPNYDGDLFQVAQRRGVPRTLIPLFPRELFDFFAHFNSQIRRSRGNLIIWARDRERVYQRAHLFLSELINSDRQHILFDQIGELRNIHLFFGREGSLTHICPCCTAHSPCLVCDFTANSLATLERIFNFLEAVERRFTLDIAYHILSYRQEGGFNFTVNNLHRIIYFIRFIHSHHYAPEICVDLNRTTFINWSNAVGRNSLVPWPDPRHTEWIVAHSPFDLAIGPFDPRSAARLRPLFTPVIYIGPDIEHDNRTPWNVTVFNPERPGGFREALNIDVWAYRGNEEEQSGDESDLTT